MALRPTLLCYRSSIDFEHHCLSLKFGISTLFRVSAKSDLLDRLSSQCNSMMDCLALEYRSYEASSVVCSPEVEHKLGPKQSPRLLSVVAPCSTCPSVAAPACSTAVPSCYRRRARGRANVCRRRSIRNLAPRCELASHLSDGDGSKSLPTYDSCGEESAKSTMA